MLPLLLAAVMALIAVGWLFYLGSPTQRIVLGLVLAAVVPSGYYWWSHESYSIDPPENRPVRSQLEQQTKDLTAIPVPNRKEGFVSSESCRSCHPEQFSSWHDTYHRTMTQIATPESVIPSFDDVTLSSRGRNYHLYRKGDEFWVKTVNPALEVQSFIQKKDAPGQQSSALVDRKIAMTTGSHFHQTYWMQNPNGTFIQFPWVYHINSDRWVYRIDSFLRPPTDKVTFNIWNISCIDCHATGAEPHVNPHDHTMRSIGELGISCEACHGPGQEHVRWANSVTDSASPMETRIVNPNHLDARAASQICGHCHSVSDIHDMQSWLAEGDAYEPGRPETFELRRTILRRAEDIIDTNENFGTSIKTRFWPDGTVRTGGREFNGLIRSRCFLEGEGSRQLSCLSCHSMHDYESPNKLIDARVAGDRMCLQCHDQPEYTSQLAEHTHHPVDSAGSRCVNCHMPRTSYALFTAIRSHRIQSPRVRNEHRGERPNACNLCHLDRTKQWTASNLTEWYGHPTPDLSEDSRQLAAGLLWGLKGDAAQRAVIAGHLGRDITKNTIQTGWEVPLLAELMRDRYSAVRYMAYESLRTNPQYSDVDYDFDAAELERQQAVDAVLAKWRKNAPRRSEEFSPEFSRRVLIDAEGNRRVSEYLELLDKQDQRPISIVE